MYQARKASKRAVKRITNSLGIALRVNTLKMVRSTREVKFRRVKANDKRLRVSSEW
jgi:hypothetical protein